MDWPWFRRTMISAAKYAAVGASAATIVVLVAPPLLGFTASGVAAGSLAAAIQSAVYGAAVPAGSLFAILQSIGATGAILPAIMAGLGAGTGCGVARIIVDAAARAYRAAGDRIRKELAQFLKKLAIMGLLAGPELQRILNNPRGAVGG